MIIRSKAPLRLGFGGGGTDVHPFCRQEGGAVLNATISQYAYTTIITVDTPDITIQSLDFKSSVTFSKSENYSLDGEMKLAKGVISRLCEGRDQGFKLFTKCDAPPGSGLGSSSTMVVSLIGAFSEWWRLPYDNYTIAKLAYDIERHDLALLGGQQDQYAATFGGFNLMEFVEDQVIVNPLRIKRETVNELEFNLLLCYTGLSRSSGNVIQSQVNNYKEDESHFKKVMRELKQNAFDMKNALLLDQTRVFGELLDEGWAIKKKLTDTITSQKIDEMYHESKKIGVIGGKITGAGGGGFLMLYCEYNKKKEIANLLMKMGGQILDFSFGTRGMETWRVGS